MILSFGEYGLEEYSEYDGVVYWLREVTDYYLMLQMEMLGKIPPATKLIALELMK